MALILDHWKAKNNELYSIKINEKSDEFTIAKATAKPKTKPNSFMVLYDVPLIGFYG